MASSVSRQDEPNRALWLATRAVKMEPSCPLGTTRCIQQAKFHQKPYNKSFIDQVCSVKMAGYWPRSLFASLWSINTQKKRELGQYPAILTSHLVNNPNFLPAYDLLGGARSLIRCLVRSSPEQVVWVRALAGDIVLCSWARHFTFTVPLSTQVYKWVRANFMLGVTL